MSSIPADQRAAPSPTRASAAMDLTRSARIPRWSAALETDAQIVSPAPYSMTAMTTSGQVRWLLLVSGLSQESTDVSGGRAIRATSPFVRARHSIRETRRLDLDMGLAQGFEGSGEAGMDGGHLGLVPLADLDQSAVANDPENIGVVLEHHTLDKVEVEANVRAVVVDQGAPQELECEAELRVPADDLAVLERCPIGLNRPGFRGRRRCDSMRGFPRRRAGCPQPCQRICVSVS